MATIRDHIAGSELPETWVQSGIITEGSADKILHGKDVKSEMRLHKITVEPTWCILLPQMMSFIEENNPDMYQDLNSLMTCRSQVNPNHISEVFLAPNHHIRHTRFKRYP